MTATGAEVTATAADAVAALVEASEPDRVPVLERYFQTQPGGYGEGDRFRGVRVPGVRRIARRCRTLPLNGVTELLKSAMHEDRLLAVIVLVDRYAREGSDVERRKIRNTYLSNREGINNWDLVDVSAPGVIGRATLEEGNGLLKALAYSPGLWDRRMAIIATLAHIRESRFEATMEIAEALVDDPHDLIHKAVGWMLREVWTRNADLCESFLARHYRQAPRTMIRYATEKMDPEYRRRFRREQT